MGIKALTTLTIAILSLAISAQDLVYTVIGQIEDNPVKVDSILIENINNGRRLLFDNLQDQEYYRIDLSAGKILDVPNRNFAIEDLLRITKNVPGNLEISVLSNRLKEINTTIINLQGKVLWVNNDLKISLNSTINFLLPGDELYIIRINSAIGHKAFLSTGSKANASIGVTINGSSMSENEYLKKAGEDKFSDFSFQEGDSLRISAFRENYYARPKIFVISGSETINFIFNPSQVNISGTSDVYTNVHDSTFTSIEYVDSTGIVTLIPKYDDTVLMQGDIITVDLDTAGYLRKVTGVQEVGGKLILETEQATMNELFVNKSFKLNTALIEPSSTLKSSSTMMDISKALTDKQGYIHPLKIIVFDENGTSYTRSAIEKKSTADEIRQPIVDAEIDFSNTDLYGKEGDNVHFFVSEGNINFKTDAVFEFDFTYEGEFSEDTKVKKGDLNKFEFYLEATAGVKTKLELEMADSWSNKGDDDKPEHLFKIIKTRAEFAVPPGVPVWIDFDINMYRDLILEADASLHADWGFEVTDTLRLGGTYTKATKDLTPISEFKHHDEIYPLNIEGKINASARLELFPRVDIKLYSIFGPYAEVIPYVQGNYNGALQSQITPENTETFIAYNADLNVGLDFRIGTQLDLILFDKQYGPKEIPGPFKPLWWAPHNLEVLSELPEETATGTTLTLNYTVTDNLGIPLNLVPVYFEGDGTFNKYIGFTDAYGNLSVDWTIGEAVGVYNVKASVFKADKTVADFISESVVAVTENGDLESGTFTDTRDSTTYNWVRIGTQTWMAENLAYLPSVSPSSSGSYTDPYYYVYNYQGTNVTEAKNTYIYQTYGVLYNWTAALNACPNGWDLPSDEEWTTLENYLITNGYNYDGITTGNKIAKSLATSSGWTSSLNAGAVGNSDYPDKRNVTGFSALPGGGRYSSSLFYNIGNYGTWWSATESGASSAWDRGLGYFTGTVDRSDGAKRSGISVRCVRDSENTPIADFTASLTDIKVNESIQFSDISTNEPTSWYWDFGDGDSSKLQNPIHEFNTIGNFTVSLTVSNSYGSNTEIKNNFISVKEDEGIDTVFNPNLTYGNVTDIEGNIYKTIQIGAQTWLAENLKTTKYNDDTFIPLITDNTEWSNLTTPGYCWYNNDQSAYGNTYGGLYNWYTVNTGKLCPTSWHVPDQEELSTLVNYLISNGYNYDGTSFLDKTGKSIASLSSWVVSSNEGAVGNIDYPSIRNSTGFSALAGGMRQMGYFEYLGIISHWWCSSVNSNYYGEFYSLYYDDYSMGFSFADNTYGFSVRCVKDSENTPVAEFTASATTIEEGETVQFTDQSTNNPTVWEWDFGDGNSSNQSNPTHVYSSSGIFTVLLIVSNAYGYDSISRVNYITVTENSVGETGSFTDTRDSTTYNWVRIGTQTWMAENLAYLPSLVGPGKGSITTPYHYVYDYNGTNVTEAKATANYQTYGVLYNWPAALIACPAGWHLPTDAEWSELEGYLIDKGYNYDGTPTGNKIAKSLATASGWNSHTDEGTIGNTDYPEKQNATGFSAIPGGYFDLNGPFYSAGDGGLWWSNSEYSSSYAWYRLLLYNFSDVSRFKYIKDAGLSVRCVRD